MAKSNQRKTAQINLKTAELALAAPQVMAHRFMRMALAGAQPSVRDQKEFQRMFTEKQAAFSEAWVAMGIQMLKANQSLATAAFFDFYNPLLFYRSYSALYRSLAKTMHGSTLNVLEKGLAPVHRSATANSRRLAKTHI